MKILVAVKRVVDYNVKVHPLADNSDVDIANAKMSMNPFDEIAVEASVRLKEKGIANEVVALSIGPDKTVDTLRVAMAIGADRSIHIKAEPVLDPITIASLIASIARREQPDLILMGKQATDNDAAQVPQMVSAMLDMPVATFVNKIDVEGTTLTVTSETDAGLMRMKASLPAVISADLRLAEPRYVTLPSMMKARKKPVEVIEAASLGIDTARRTTLISVVEPPSRAAGVEVKSVDELIDKLKNTVKVL